MYYNEDDRAQRLLDVFEVLDGQDGHLGVLYRRQPLS